MKSERHTRFWNAVLEIIGLRNLVNKHKISHNQNLKSAKQKIIGIELDFVIYWKKKIRLNRISKSSEKKKIHLIGFNMECRKNHPLHNTAIGLLLVFLYCGPK